ncbi:ACT domain-containing protein [Methanocella sp. CWC-04]|uniref:ACT domain-containing protein n=1 Tax=Methanooceanicella nereidis TaxID=2052831 RepID=A0AAP2RDB1_9EURY|nr:ACT domain-containing protein [Methanocella sp. CWC-04]MCD1295149.1 ACT domain-containing protein [Methanocella sp. CWC-04]
MKLSLSILDETFAICTFPKGTPIPEWVIGSEFYSVTKTYDELSVVCPQRNIPEGVKYNKGWRCLKVQGPLDFSLTGILASLAMPLASAGVSIFVFSSYDTDHIMVKGYDLDNAVKVLADAGHTIVRQS